MFFQNFFLFLFFVYFSIQITNNRPIIGIVTEPSLTELEKYGSQYIAASYVKWIEGSGARVVPIKYTLSSSELIQILDQINGVLFPGGDASLDGTQFYQTLKSIYNYAIQKNQEGIYFPIYGTCLGFEALNILTSQDMNILSKVGMENITLPLYFTTLTPKSRMFKNASSEILLILSSKNVTLNNHEYGVLVDTFNNNNKLSQFYSVLSYNYEISLQKLPFVSTIESIDYPIYGTQFHPEKNIYEWRIDEDINHSFDAVLISQYFGNFFVSESRKNSQHFANQTDEANALIYNFPIIYTAKDEPSFEQCYFFEP